MNVGWSMLAVLGALTSAALLMPAGSSAQAPRIVMMASTIGPIDAGMVAALEDAFLRQTGIVVRHAGAGTGAALEMAKTGSFDLVMVHARALEDKFVSDGFGVDRRDVMYNDFVILGPAADPASIRGERSAAAAFRKIAAVQAAFVTRGDNSGTHVKEKEIWQKAGLTPAGPWYQVWERGASGNAPTTRHADERQAYVLMDRATYVTLKQEIRLQILVEKDIDLLNYIAIIQVSPTRFPEVNAEGARRFADWLVSDEAQQLIKQFGVDRYGEALFFPNSEQWRNKHPRG
jgi:tungstate transport system substrate-binding protein